MVGALSRLNGAPTRGRRRIVELAGPAGVGKSTLVKALEERLHGTPHTVWGLPVLPLLGNGLRLVPTFGGLWLRSGSLLWNETRHMVRLRTLYRVLERRADPAGLLIFDEGPVFALTWLRGFGHQVLQEQPSDHWWRSAIAEWAGLIDTVIVLDAADQVLAQRIRTRPHPHEVKDFPDSEMARWMGRYRRALDWVLSQLARHGGPAAVRLSTDIPAEQLSEEIVEALSEIRRAG